MFDFSIGLANLLEKYGLGLTITSNTVLGTNLVVTLLM